MIPLNSRDDELEFVFEEGRVESVRAHPDVFIRISDRSGEWEFMLGRPTRAVEEIEELVNRKPLRVVVSREGHLTLQFEDLVSIDVEAADRVEAWEIRHGGEWAIFALPGGGFSSHGIEL